MRPHTVRRLFHFKNGPLNLSKSEQFASPQGKLLPCLKTLFTMFLVLLAQFSQIISGEQHFLSSFTPTRISKFHASWWLTCTQTRNFIDFLHTLYTRVASFDFGEKHTQETIFFEVRSSPCSHQPVIENCLFQHAVKQPVKLTSWIIFFVPTLYKDFNLLQTEQVDSQLRLSLALTSWAFSRASVLTDAVDLWQV